MGDGGGAKGGHDGSLCSGGPAGLLPLHGPNMPLIESTPPLFRRTGFIYRDKDSEVTLPHPDEGEHPPAATTQHTVNLDGVSLGLLFTHCQRGGHVCFSISLFLCHWKKKTSFIPSAHFLLLKLEKVKICVFSQQTNSLLCSK